MTLIKNLLSKYIFYLINSHLPFLKEYLVTDLSFAVVVPDLSFAVDFVNSVVEDFVDDFEPVDFVNSVVVEDFSKNPEDFVGDFEQQNFVNSVVVVEDFSKYHEDFVDGDFEKQQNLCCKKLVVVVYEEEQALIFVVQFSAVEIMNY